MPRLLRKGVELLAETIGDGGEIERQHFYQIKLRCWLHQGDKIRWQQPWGLTDRCRLLEQGTVLITDVRLDREFLIPGLFYGLQGMRVAGTRRLKISPHLAYGEKGVPGVVPENALLFCEVTILEERL